MAKEVSVIIPVYNRWDLTENCLKSLARHAPQALEVIIVDNGSTDATAAYCPVLGRELFGNDFIYLRQEKNRNFAPACNIGAGVASGNLLFFLNNDTILLENWLPPLLSALGSPPYPTVVAPLLLYPSIAGKQDRVQHLGLCFTPLFYPVSPYRFFPYSHPVCHIKRQYQALTGAAFLLSKNVFTEQGGFDEDFINGGEDIELSLRLRASGHILTCIPESRVYHLESQTSGIHKHAHLGAKLLKEKALHLIVPDLHLCAEKGGYELALTPALKIYFDLPERRKKIYAKQVDRATHAEELEELIEKEPLCHAAYLKLIRLYQKEEKTQELANTCYLAMNLTSGHPVPARILAGLALSGDGVKMVSEAKNICDWYKNTAHFFQVCDEAQCAIAVTKRLGMEGMASLFEKWLFQRDAHGGFFGPQFEKSYPLPGFAATHQPNVAVHA